ncbi:MAG: CsiV family protein [Woeseiaceae bacterium]|nr:CsiV family protein [Woeseiaceae bacterium]
MIRTFGILLLIGSAPLAIAQEAGDEEPPARRYAVEFIIFAYAEDVGLGTEIFPPEKPPAGLPEPLDGRTDGPVAVYGDRAAEALPADTRRGDPRPDDEPPVASGPTPADVDAVLLLEEEYSMGRILAQLERLDVYEPLLYGGWIQDAQPKETAVPIPLGFFGPPPAGLAGKFTLYLGRYLHLVADFELDGPAAPAADPYGFDAVASYGDERRGWDTSTAPPGPVRYRISEDRILKNGEIRYFDHPKFGLIAKVTRIETPEPAAEPLPLVGGAGE